MTPDAQLTDDRHETLVVLAAATGAPVPLAAASVLDALLASPERRARLRRLADAYGPQASDDIADRLAARNAAAVARAHVALHDDPADACCSRVLAALDADLAYCPAGCGCRVGTDDADRDDCGCDDACCDWTADRPIRAIAVGALRREAEASVRLDRDPDGQTFSVHDLPPEERT